MALRDFDTPTICNAVEVIAPDQRAAGFTTSPFVCRNPSMVPMKATREQQKFGRQNLRAAPSDDLAAALPTTGTLPSRRLQL